MERNLVIVLGSFTRLLHPTFVIAEEAVVLIARSWWELTAVPATRNELNPVPRIMENDTADFTVLVPRTSQHDKSVG